MSPALAVLVARCLMSAVIAMDASRAERPNVIVIMTDDQGTADLGAAGAKDVETPHLDALASRGVRFSQFYAAAPVCSPSRAALLTGRHPFRAGVPSNIGAQGMPGREITIAEMLRSAGYAIAHVGKWHLGSSPDTAPQRRGSTARSATSAVASTITLISSTGAARTTMTSIATARRFIIPADSSAT